MGNRRVVHVGGGRTLVLRQETARETLSTQLRADCDQRWAQAGDWLWEQDGVVMARLAELLEGRPALLAMAMRCDEQLGAAVQHLAALALDELLARDRGREGDDDGRD